MEGWGSATLPPPIIIMTPNFRGELSTDRNNISSTGWMVRVKEEAPFQLQAFGGVSLFRHRHSRGRGSS